MKRTQAQAFESLQTNKKRKANKEQSEKLAKEEATEESIIYDRIEFLMVGYDKQVDPETSITIGKYRGHGFNEAKWKDPAYAQSFQKVLFRVRYSAKKVGYKVIDLDNDHIEIQWDFKPDVIQA